MSELPRQIVSRFRCFDKQRPVLANDRGIDVIVAGIGGSKTWLAALKHLFFGLRHPLRRNGDPTEWLVLGRDYPVVHEMQLAEIVKHARQLAYPAEPREMEIKDGNGPASAMSWAFEGDHGLTLREPSPSALAEAWVERWVSGDRYVVRPLVSIQEKAVIARNVGGVRPCIELTTGVKFWGFSATDTSRMRAFAFDGSWIDEAEWHTIASLEMAVQRQRSGKGGLRLSITSSPAGAGQGWLWGVISGRFPRWDKLRMAPNKLRVHRWTSEDNPTNDPEQLAAIRAVLDATSPGKAAGELDGLFTGTDEAPGMGPLDYVRAFVGRVYLGLEDLRPAALGVDIGETVDFTWLTVLSATGVVLAMERFNKGSPGAPHEGFYPYVEARAEQLALKWRVPKIVVDIAKAGIGVQEHLASKLKGRVVVEGYRTDAPGKKSAAIEMLGTALSRGDIRIPTAWTTPGQEERPVEWVDFLAKEFGDLVEVVVGPNKRRFTHPEGAHDDGIISLALAWHAIAGRREPPPPNLSKWRPIRLGPTR